jgi:hypothetical protein
VEVVEVPNTLGMEIAMLAGILKVRVMVKVALVQHHLGEIRLIVDMLEDMVKGVSIVVLRGRVMQCRRGSHPSPDHRR